ncbi:hypothetical protein V3C99_011489 [Haemonchus contortus]
MSTGSSVDGRASPLTVTKVAEWNTGIINSISTVSSRAGFDYSENDQDKRRERMQEQINNCVTSKQIRVLMMPNVTRAPLKEIARKFIKDVVRYDIEMDPFPLTWLRHAGNYGDFTSFRAEMTYSFWEHFLTKGSKNLLEFNRKNNTNVKLLRGKTMKHTDLENLGLYLRQKIRKELLSTHAALPEVVVKGPYVMIKDRANANSLLGWDYRDWKGTPIKFLLNNAELQNYENDILKWGVLKLESLNSLATKRNDENSHTEVTRTIPRKRDLQDGASTSSTKRTKGGN